MKRNKPLPIDVYLAIRDFKCNPDEITKVLKVKPSKSWKAGDKFKDKIKYKNNAWNYASEIKSIYLEEHLLNLLKKLKAIKKLDEFVSEKNRHIQVVVNVKAGDTTPVLSVSSATMVKLSDLNLSIDVDLYAW